MHASQRIIEKFISQDDKKGGAIIGKKEDEFITRNKNAEKKRTPSGDEEARLPCPCHKFYFMKS